MPKKTFILLYLIFILFLEACNTLYVPSTVNVPLLSNKKEITSRISLGVLGTGTYNLQAGYSPIEHLGIMGSMMYNNFIAEGDINKGDLSPGNLAFDSGGLHTDHLYELGIGYYTKSDDGWLLEIYGGYGIDFIQHNIGSKRIEPSEWPTTTARYDKLFLQPTLSHLTEHFDIAFTIRISNLKFSEVVSTNRYIDGKIFNIYMIDPTFTLRFGFKYVKPFIQGGIIVPWSSDNNTLTNYYVHGNPFNFNIGICIDINRVYDPK